ncbi:baseplate J/gp47 family protein [Dyadobacter sp. CY107]|uniref:baseplate J/gp47 family protein n=1 Tax=Dyadobacter fanqingshengii TaxID=2906443 RepID=UPI001F2BDE02|nr:baseplate J/gp47 family protein [Dyadobacter fanqingshengii]MCF2504887.1 baseplate J/gp47 family protein [Dyadobacter fanqingshengii]
MKTCDCDADIIRDGSGRLGRFLRALDPAYNPVDDRSLADLLVFTKKFSARIRFHKLAEDACEDVSWKAFFAKDVSFIAATILLTDLSQIEKDYLETRQHFDRVRTLSTFKALFAPISGIAERLDKWLSQSAIDFPLYQDVQLAIRSSMRMQMLKVFELDKAAVLINSEELGIDFEPVNEDTWNLDVVIPFVGSLYDGVTTEDKLFHASLQVDTIFNAALHVLTNVVAKAEEYLTISIEKYPKHQPHIALFIAFLELFRIAQEQLNGLTERHLNFYYNDVLHIKEKAAQPDQVNVIFELAKDAAVCYLPKGTPLSAGKDAFGIDQVYVTDRDMVINKAKVKDVKNVFVDQCPQGLIRGFYARSVADSKDGEGKQAIGENGWWNPYGSDSLKHQNSCGQVIRHRGSNYARIGFAMASPQLRMEGGNRTIRLKMKGISKLLTKSEDFTIRLSGAKKWIDIDKPMVAEPDNGFHFSTSRIFPAEPTYHMDPKDPDAILVYIPNKEDAITGYDPKMHTEATFPTNQPVLQILLKQDVLSITSEEWENAALDFGVTEAVVNEVITPTNNFELFIDVKGLKNVIIQNEQGVQPADSPFHPFTPLPTPGSPLYIGNEEMFNKPISDFSVRPEWQIGSGPFANIRYEVRVNKSWVSVKEEEGRRTFQQPAQRDIVTFDSFSENLSKGFIKMVFDDPMQNDPAQLMLLGNQSKINAIALNYASTLNRLEDSLDQFFHVYPFGVVEAALDQQDIALRREASKVNVSMRDDVGDGRVWAANRALPDFKYGMQTVSLAGVKVEKMSEEGWNDVADIDFEKNAAVRRNTPSNSKNGEFSLDSVSVSKPNQYTGARRQEASLYIGLEGLVAPQNLSLLFQVAEGTGMDDDRDPPKINWSYLSENQWKMLPVSNIILDTTYGLQTTGIVLFDIPEDATSQNTIMTAGLHWIAASVDTDSHRLPSLVKIVAQAVPVRFSDRGNAPEHYEQSLPAKRITTMLDKPEEIKTIEQPFASYNGVPAEIGKEFYMRVSERLRHKNRAITTSDYEKLVLEYFPSVFKVKCIPHTDPNCFCRDKNGEPGDECNPGNPQQLPKPVVCCGPQVAPGHVLIVPIEDLKNRNAINILQPRTSYRVLREIESLLKKRTSPFVKIHARNPVYEEILTAFRVQFYYGLDKGFFLTKLNEELREFLTPWAFDASADVVFGSQIYASSVINFIEERPYVDFITDFMMYQVKCDCCGTDALKDEIKETGRRAKAIADEMIAEQKKLDPTDDKADPIAVAKVINAQNHPAGFLANDPGALWDFIRDESETMVEWVIRNVLSWFEISQDVALQTVTNKYEQQLVLKVVEWYINLVKNMGLKTVDDLMKYLPVFKMVTLAEPTNERALLVSAQQHIIMLYEAEPAIDPCEKNKLTNRRVDS